MADRTRCRIPAGECRDPRARPRCPQQTCRGPGSSESQKPLQPRGRAPAPLRPPTRPPPPEPEKIVRAKLCLNSPSENARAAVLLLPISRSHRGRAPHSGPDGRGTPPWDHFSGLFVTPKPPTGSGRQRRMTTRSASRLGPGARRGARGAGGTARGGPDPSAEGPDPENPAFGG
jgi:hypothetical protein